MGYTFNIDEIFEIAVQMETNGFDFYRKAADEIKDPAMKELLKELADMEVDHKKTFGQLRKELVDAKDADSFFDPQGEAVRYLHALANTKAFFEKAIDTSSLEEVFKAAIMAEKDSIVFYLGMRDSVSDEATKNKLEAIIQEEMSHVRLLSERLLALKTG
ncbi:MAG: ferritin family protein [Proteobacteria bacterium]|nr:ferritin family protein [Pseudomonadota bacterium]